MKRGKAREIPAPGDSVHFAACRAHVKANLRGFAFDDDRVADESFERTARTIIHANVREESVSFSRMKTRIAFHINRQVIHTRGRRHVVAI